MGADYFCRGPSGSSRIQRNENCAKSPSPCGVKSKVTASVLPETHLPRNKDHLAALVRARKANRGPSGEIEEGLVRADWHTHMR